MLTECCTDPEVAVTVMVEVTGVFPPPPLLPVLLPLPPHPVVSSAKPRTAAGSRRAMVSLRLRLKAKSKTEAKIAPLPHGRERRWRAALVELAVTVRVVVAAAGGVTLAGAKLQLIPAGRLEHEKAMDWLNPFCGVTVSARVALLPWVTVIAPDALERVKSGALTVTL
jgi:hypothetical protein